MKKLLHFSKTLAGTVSLNNQNNKVRTSTAKTRTTYRRNAYKNIDNQIA